MILILCILQLKDRFRVERSFSTVILRIHGSRPHISQNSTNHIIDQRCGLMDYRGEFTDRWHVQWGKSFALHPQTRPSPPPLLPLPLAFLSLLLIRVILTVMHKSLQHRADWLVGRKCHRSPESRGMGD